MYFRIIIIILHLLLLGFHLAALNWGIILGKEYVLLFVLLSVVSMLYFFRRANYLIMAFIFGFTAVLLTAFLVMLMKESLDYSGWTLEELLQTDIVNQANIAIMCGISSFCLGGALLDRNNKKLFFRKSRLLTSSEKIAKDQVALFSAIIGLFYSYLTGAASLGEVSYAQGGGGEQAYGQEFSAASYILGIVFTGVSFYLAYHGSSFKKLFVKMIFAMALFTVVYFNVYAGDRDGMLTFAIIFVGWYWVYSKAKQWKKIGIILASGVMLYFALMIVGGARSEVADRGIIGAIAQTEVVRGRDRGFSPIQDLDLLPTMYWQTLATVRLVNQGNYFNMRSFINLVPQSIPTPVANLLGIVRPMNSAWELGRYHEHGGGFFIIGETYWNGGITAVIFVFFLLAGLFLAIERWFYKQEKYLMAFYFGLVASFPTCVYYSIQGMFRWIEVWFFIAVAYKIIITTVKRSLDKKRLKNQSLQLATEG